MTSEAVSSAKSIVRACTTLPEVVVSRSAVHTIDESPVPGIRGRAEGAAADPNRLFARHRPTPDARVSEHGPQNPPGGRLAGSARQLRDVSRDGHAARDPRRDVRAGGARDCPDL